MRQDARQEPVELFVRSWAPLFSDGLLARFAAEHPRIAVTVDEGWGMPDYHDTELDALTSDARSSSVLFVDEFSLGKFRDESDSLVDLDSLGAADLRDRLLPWAWSAGASVAGTAQVGVPMTVGGMAMCYRADLFEEAGLPSARADVDAAIGDTWEGFIEFGQIYRAESGRSFLDNATYVYPVSLVQQGAGHLEVTQEGELDVQLWRAAYKAALHVIEADLSANIGRWSPDWRDGLVNGDYAVVLCPSWFPAYIAGQLDERDSDAQWRVADLPGPGGNWGGQHLMLPRDQDPREVDAAWVFIEWALANAQQEALASDYGQLSPVRDVLNSPVTAALGDPAFGPEPFGRLFARSAAEVPAPFYVHPCERDVREWMETILNDIQAAGLTPVDYDEVALNGAHAVLEECVDARR